MSSSLGMGGVVEEGRATVLPKRLWLSREEPEDRVDTRLTGRSPSASSNSMYPWPQQSGLKSMLPWTWSLVDRVEDNWGDSGRGKRNTERRKAVLLSILVQQKKHFPQVMSLLHLQFFTEGRWRPTIKYTEYIKHLHVQISHLQLFFCYSSLPSVLQDPNGCDTSVILLYFIDVMLVSDSQGKLHVSKKYLGLNVISKQIQS